MERSPTRRTYGPEGGEKMNTKLKVSGVLASAALMLSLFAPKAFADSTLEISRNGANSDNKIDVKVENNCEVKQKSNTVANVGVSVSSNTGGNVASGNTGGDTSINTGNITTNITVSTTGGSNTATDPCCCQQCSSGDQTNSALISGNGYNSNNDIKVNKKKNSKITQTANTLAAVGIGTTGKTGKNTAKNNTGGTTSVDTGKIETTVDVTTAGGANTLN